MGQEMISKIGWIAVPKAALLSYPRCTLHKELVARPGRQSPRPGSPKVTPSFLEA
jgi:hypothetical protein